MGHIESGPMRRTDLSSHLILAENCVLFEQLSVLAREKSLVFFAGLPGTGKSLLIHQLAHLAVMWGRVIHLLQWDEARPVFESHAAGRYYPSHDGVTHAVIRKAVGLWARDAIIRWRKTYAAPRHLLIGETPFVGNRLIELARSQNDAAETLLRDESCTFVIPVPSIDVRRFIEAERQKRSVNPVHEREVEDAPPHVLRALWYELVRVAPSLGGETPVAERSGSYDPILYQKIYEAMLRHRHAQTLSIHTTLPTATLSAHDFAIERSSVVPTEDEVTHFIHMVSQLYPVKDSLECAVEQWYRI